MRNRAALLSLVAALVLIGTSIVPTGAQPTRPSAQRTPRLEMYTVVVDQATAGAITSAGYDVASSETTAAGKVRLTIVAYPFERSGIEKLAGRIRVWRNDAGFTARQLELQQAAAGFKVWMDYDDGFLPYMHDLEAANEDILDLYPVGPETWQGRDVIALRLTADVQDSDPGDKPAVLYSSLIHAREWITGEVNRRLLEWFIKGWNEEKPQVVDILTDTELWFVLVQNPDGYQYTFDEDRLWRKNLRNNDGQPGTSVLDGVDGNRNFAEHWNYDDEGSASIISDQTYRGPFELSEPETQALDAVLAMSRPEYHISYHSFGELLLYPFGFQVNTPSADDPIFVAWAGTDKKPAVQGYNPGVGADLYTTNGEQTDYAYTAYGALSITPELGDGNQDSGFVFPDSEGEVQREFMINLDFAVAAAKSATDPDNPKSPVKITTQPFYLNTATLDPQKSFNPMSDFTFAHSFNGADQPVQVLARRDLDNDGDQDPVTLNYSIDGGPVQTAPTDEWDPSDPDGHGPSRYGDTGDVYYRIMRGHVTGAPNNSNVTVWFTGAGKTSASFTFHVEKASAADVLILADTDYTGPSTSPPYSPAIPANGPPPFITTYTSAVTASGRTHDLYDVDAMGAAPDHLGVLGHYDAVIWYTANDLLSRVAGQPGGTGAETRANTMMLEVRAFLNEGGKLLYTGRHAGWQFANAFDYNPITTPPFCDAVDVTVDDGCLLLSDDFLQYWLGAYIFIEDGGARANGTSFDVIGTDDPYDDASTDPWEVNQSFDGFRGATNQSFITTSSLLKAADYGQFTSTAPAEWNTLIAGPYEPHTDDYYLYSQRADIRYQRLMNTFIVDSGTELSFFISHDTEPNWDFVFVELEEPDGDWVTLPEASVPSHTSSSTGDSCPEGWHELHPWLVQYQGADCAGLGWNAASGNSQGWTEWVFDLSAYAGQEVTVSISYVSDWAIQGLGVWIDDIVAPTSDPTATTGFEGEDMGSWTIGDPTDIDSGVNALDWDPTLDVGFTEGAMTSMTPDDADFRTLYFGFAFENVVDPLDREEIMADALAYLIGPVGP